jgi:glycosyltransferase involved in cell wall biosynthesis
MPAVLMVSGSWPPEACGVGDYTERLCRELEAGGISVVRLSDPRLSHIYSRDVVRRATQARCDLVHIQYPTAGYGRSYTPAALPAAIRDKPVVVTLHEYSVFRWYRRNWFAPYARRCAARIFTTDEERQLFAQRFPRRCGVDDTIEIASNIPVALPTATRDRTRIVYFGLIAPNKGIEDVLTRAELARATGTPFSFEVIGAVQERHRDYADAVRRRGEAAGVAFFFNIPDDAVAKRLASAGCAYLPFPDGASGKRGTLAAALINKLIVITRHSAITPAWIAAATLHAGDPASALSQLNSLLTNRAAWDTAARKSSAVDGRYRWDSIARRHADLYQSLLSGRRALAREPAEASLRPAGISI